MKIDLKFKVFVLTQKVLLVDFPAPTNTSGIRKKVESLAGTSVPYALVKTSLEILEGEDKVDMELHERGDAQKEKKWKLKNIDNFKKTGFMKGYNFIVKTLDMLKRYEL